MIEEAKTAPRAMDIDLSVQGSTEPDPRRCAKRAAEKTAGKGIAVYLADMHAPIREFSQQTGCSSSSVRIASSPMVDASRSLPGDDH
jgi:hypothetical protein